MMMKKMRKNESEFKEPEEFPYWMKKTISSISSISRFDKVWICWSINLVEEGKTEGIRHFYFTTLGNRMESYRKSIIRYIFMSQLYTSRFYRISFYSIIFLCLLHSLWKVKV
jgi:hypothetical protein